MSVCCSYYFNNLITHAHGSLISGNDDAMQLNKSFYILFQNNKIVFKKIFIDFNFVSHYMQLNKLNICVFYLKYNVFYIIFLFRFVILKLFINLKFYN